MADTTSFNEEGCSDEDLSSMFAKADFENDNDSEYEHDSSDGANCDDEVDAATSLLPYMFEPLATVEETTSDNAASTKEQPNRLLDKLWYVVKKIYNEAFTT